MSAWHDGEVTDAALDAHLASCEDCQAVLRDFASFDVEIQQHLAEATPARHVIDRMVKRTHRKVAPRRFKLLSFPVLTRLAACAALVAICAYLTLATRVADASLADRRRPAGEAVAANLDEPVVEDLSAFEQKLIQDLLAEFGDQAPALPAGQPASLFADVSLPSTADAANALATRGAKVGEDGVLRLSNISLVGYGAAAEDFRGTGSREFGTAQPALVDDRVRHVWLVDDAAAPLKQLQNLMPSHQQDFRELIDQKRDEYVLQFVITDNDLQRLVDHFHGLGFKLMSPQEPQPGHGQALRLSGKTIQYEIDFVRK